MSDFTTDNLKKLTKDQLMEMVIQLDKELKRIKAKMSGKVGAAAGVGVRNPNVK